MQQSLEKMWAAVRSYLARREFGAELFRLGLSFLLSAAGEGLAIAPLGPACVAAAWLCDFEPYYAFFGALFGALVGKHYAEALAVTLYMAGCLVWRACRGCLRMADKLCLLIAASALMLPVFHMGSLQSCLIGLAGVTVSLLSALVLRQAALGVISALKHRMVKESEQLCCAIVLGMAVFAASKGVIGVRVCCVLGAALSMCCVRIKGTPSVIAALLMGLACAFGADIEYAGILAACALIAAVTRNKWGVLSVYTAALCAFVYLTGQGTGGYVEAGAAALLFAMVPERVLRSLESCVLPAGMMRAARELASLKKRLHGLSRVLERLSGVQSGEFAAREMAGISGTLLHLAEDAPKKRRRFSVTTGAAACPKAGNSDTGDCMGMRQAENCAVLLLSDGMGSGEEAHRESAAAVALLGDLLSVGFELETALPCVNRVLLQRAEAQTDMYATLDVLLVDLSLGSGCFVKYGAPPSFLLRGGRAHTIYAEALPVGILENADPALHEVSLKRGDTVVMMTDGVFDALGEGLLAAVMDLTKGQDVDKAAADILYAARERSGADDMTVMVVRVD